MNDIGAQLEEAGKRIKGYQTQVDFQQKRISELDQQNAILLDALGDSESMINKLSDRLLATEWYGGSVLACEITNVQKANKKALAQVKGNRNG